MNTKTFLSSCMMIALLVMMMPRTCFSQAAKYRLGYNKLAIRFSMDMGKIAVAERAAELRGISSEAWSFIRMSGGLAFLRYFFVDAGFGILHFKDKAQFSETVIGGILGDFPHEAKSGISASDGFYGAGINLPLVFSLSVEGMYAKGGLSGRREIEGCKDCTKYELFLKGGDFVQYRLIFGKQKADMVGKDQGGFAGGYIAYRQFLTGPHAEKMFLLGFLARYDL